MRITKKTGATIALDDVTTDHIIVGHIGGKPVIASCQVPRTDSYVFLSLQTGFTRANSYFRGLSRSEMRLKELLNHFVDGSDKFEAFDNWRDAFQWLLDNTD